MLAPVLTAPISKFELLTPEAPVRDWVRSVMSFLSLLPKASTLRALRSPALVTEMAPSSTCTSDKSKLPSLLRRMSPTSLSPITASLTWVLSVMPNAALACTFLAVNKPLGKVCWVVTPALVTERSVCTCSMRPMAADNTMFWSSKPAVKWVAENEALVSTMLPPAEPAVSDKPARVATTWVSASASKLPSSETP